MPFNEKGEFIRFESNSRRSSARTTHASQAPIPSAGPARVTSSEDRPGRHPGPQAVRQRQPAISGWEVLGGILAILIGLAALLGLIWLLVAFHRWFLIGVALVLIRALKGLCR